MRSFTLRSSAPIDFEYMIDILEKHPSFDVSPLEGKQKKKQQDIWLFWLTNMGIILNFRLSKASYHTTETQQSI